MDTGAHLHAQGEKLLCSLQGQLAGTHETHPARSNRSRPMPLRKHRNFSPRLRTWPARIAALNESVRHLESDLDAHLEGLASEIVSGAGSSNRERCGSGPQRPCKHAARMKSKPRLSEMCGHLRTIQNRIENSFSASLQDPGRGSRAVDHTTIRGTRATIPGKVAARTRQGLEFRGERSGPTTSSGTRTRGRPKLDCKDSIVGRARAKNASRRGEFRTACALNFRYKGLTSWASPLPAASRKPPRRAHHCSSRWVGKYTASGTTIRYPSR